jgi:hypothetical protein
MACGKNGKHEVGTKKYVAKRKKKIKLREKKYVAKRKK